MPNWSEEDRIERFAQEVTPPFVRGVAFDPRSGDLVFSSCPRHEFACDLIKVSTTNVHPAGSYFRRSREFGFTRPAFSPDGARLAVARTPRSQRVNQLRVTQDLIEIDLSSGSEHTLLNANGGRFDRVEYLSSDTLAVVRSFQSSPQVRCRGNLCTDVAEVLLAGPTGVRSLPMRTTPYGANVTIIHLPDGALIGTTRTGGIESASNAYVADLRRPALDAAHPSWTLGLRDARNRFGVIDGWPDELVSHRGYWLEAVPFCATRAYLVALNQTHVANARYAAYVTKLRRPLRYRVVTLENRGRIPWDTAREVIISPPVGSWN